jgi:hypothetical protein
MQVSEWEDDSGFVQRVVKSIPNTTFANGISRTRSSATLQAELNMCPNNDCNEECGLWCLDMMPKPNREFGYGGNMYNLSGVSDLSKAVKIYSSGAYNMRGATILSCMVLLSYTTELIALPWSLRKGL